MPDRFGSQYARELTALATCIASKECCYVSSPFLYHKSFKDPEGWHEYTGLKSTCEDSDKNLPLLRKRDLPEETLASAAHHLQSSVSSEIKDEIKLVARSMYYSTPKPSALDCEHVVHIRRGDVQRNKDMNQVYKSKHVTDETWMNVLHEIHAKNPEARLCILSDGTTEELKKFEIYADVYNNTDEKHAFHTMVEARNLYVSGSSQFSVAAGYLNKNNVIKIV